MRRKAIFGVLMKAAVGQTGKSKFATPNPQSPPMQTSVTINGKDIWIAYHAPSVRGRKIFGAPDSLQPEGSIWRAGADQATFLHTDADLDLNGLSVPKGEYTLYIDLDKGQWRLIVNKETGQWGINRDGSTTRKPGSDVGAAAMRMSKPPALVEQFKITLSSAGAGKGNLQFAWE